MSFNPATDHFPWHATILQKLEVDDPPIHVCFGVLIGHSLVLTSSYCVKSSRGNIIAHEDLSVILGPLSSNVHFEV